MSDYNLGKWLTFNKPLDCPSKPSKPNKTVGFLEF